MNELIKALKSALGRYYYKGGNDGQRLATNLALARALGREPAGLRNLVRNAMDSTPADGVKIGADASDDLVAFLRGESQSGATLDRATGFLNGLNRLADEEPSGTSLQEQIEAGTRPPSSGRTDLQQQISAGLRSLREQRAAERSSAGSDPSSRGSGQGDRASSGGGSEADRSGSSGGAPPMPDDDYAISRGLQFNGVPADGQVWKVGNKYMLAYNYRNNGTYVYYTIPDNESLNAIFPSGVPRARELTMKQVNKMGAVAAGTSHLLRGMGEGWEESFNKRIKVMSRTRPWLKDAEVVAVHLAAMVEGRDITDADLEGTAWFKDRSKGQVQYAQFLATATPEERQQYHRQFYDQTRTALVEAGVTRPSNDLIKFMSRKWAGGEWSDAYLARQITQVANPYAYGSTDSELRDFISDSGLEVDTLKAEGENIKDMVMEWLGPQHGSNWGDGFYQMWAGKIMDDPNQEQALIDLLKKRRMALYPEYQNEDLRYADIAPQWENFMSQQWGITPQQDAHWNVLDKVIRANDADEAGRILRKDGVRLGVGQVAGEVMEGLSDFGGSQVVRGF